MEKTNSDQEVLMLEGDVTIYNAEKIKQDLFSYLSKNKKIRVDLMDVDEFDTAGFQVLLFGKQYAEKNNIDLKLISPSDAVGEVFRLYGMSSLLENCHES